MGRMQFTAVCNFLPSGGDLSGRFAGFVGGMEYLKHPYFI